MATPIHGRSGRLYVGLASSTADAQPVANLNKWAITFSVDEVDVTCFGDSNKVSVAGLPDVGGTYAGKYDTASAQLYTAASDGAARRFYLYPTTATTTTYWFGTGTFDFNVEGDVAGPVDISGKWSASTAVAKIG